MVQRVVRHQLVAQHRLPRPHGADVVVHRRGDDVLGQVPLPLVRRVADAKRSRDAVVRVPEFDHEVHDPEEDKIAIAPTHKIVVVEGNYLTLPDAPWSELHSGDAPLLDEVWHLDCSVDDAMARVTRRHVAVGRSAEEARRKVDGNDRPNGELVCSRKGVADVLVPSYEWEGK